MTYDGHGRLKTQHKPEQNTGAVTTWNYYADDRTQQVIDARGATVNYTYNNRALVTQISSTTPNATTIPLSPTVTYTYDNVGNRTQMTDGMGTVNYEYDQLSRLTAETRSFIDSLPSAPLANNSYRLQYTWTYSGLLKSYTDPWGQQISYTQDKIGRMNSITGTPFGGVTTYANNAQYRAWGTTKHLEYGNNNAYMNITYNNKLLPQTLETIKPTTSGITTAVKQQYQYYTDGNLKYGLNEANRAFDRLYTYDHTERIRETKSGGAADPLLQATYGTPFTKSYIYNPFGQMVSKIGMDWTDPIDYNWDSTNNAPFWTYTNNRLANAIYDADGNMTDHGQSYTYRSDRKLVISTDFSNQTQIYYDGDGKELKRATRQGNGTALPWSPWKNKYRIRSSVFGGQDVSAVLQTGAKEMTYVYNGSDVVAIQYPTNLQNQAVQSVEWRHIDKSGKSVTSTTASTDPASAYGRVTEELDAEGMGVRPIPPDLGGNTYNETDAGLMLTHGSNIDAINGDGCMIDGMAVSCEVAQRAVDSGAAVQCPDNDCGSGWVIDKKGDFQHRQGFKAYADGTSGYWYDFDDPNKSGNNSGVVQIGTGSRFVKTRGQQQVGPKDPFAPFRSAEKLSDVACDKKLSEIFGGVAKAMEGAGDIDGNNRLVTGGKGHSATTRNDSAYIEFEGEKLRNPDAGGIIHTYTDERASARNDVSLFAPGGWTSATPYRSGDKISGNYNAGISVRYSNGITIEFVHVGTTNKNKTPSRPVNPGVGKKS